MEEWVVNTFIRGLALGTPLLWAALGEIYAERSGVVNLGVEGMMILGAFSAFALAQTTANPLLGLLIAGAGAALGGAAAAGHAARGVGLHLPQPAAGGAAVVRSLPHAVGDRHPVRRGGAGGGGHPGRERRAGTLLGRHLRRRAGGGGRRLPLGGLPAVLDRGDDQRPGVDRHRHRHLCLLGSPTGGRRRVPLRRALPPLVPPADLGGPGSAADAALCVYDSSTGADGTARRAGAGRARGAGSAVRPWGEVTGGG